MFHHFDVVVDIMGYTAIIILTLFYASPLAALAQVVRTKNSALFQVRDSSRDRL